MIPENRLRTYDVRELISNLADTDSVLELRPFFGLAMVTVRVQPMQLYCIVDPTRLSCQVVQSVVVRA
jgi:hypothetical protein